MSVIETKNLLLRPFCEDDAADVLEYLSGPLPNCFVGLKLNSLDAVRAEMVKRSVDTEYCFAIVLKESGKVIGEIDALPSTYEPPMLYSQEKTSLPPPDTFSPEPDPECRVSTQRLRVRGDVCLFRLPFHAEGRTPYIHLCGRLQCAQ